MRRRRTTTHNDNPGSSARRLQGLPLTVPSRDTWDGCVGRPGKIRLSLCRQRGRGSPSPSFSRRGEACILPSLSASPPFLQSTRAATSASQPRSHPVLTCAGLFLGSCLDVCGCPTGLPPPPSQPSSPVGHQTVILRSPIWLFPQSGSKAQFPSQGAPCKDNRPYGVCAAAGGGEYSQQDHGLPGQGGV